MSTLIFQVHGEPKGQPRPRAFARKMGAVHVARFYDSDVADAWKSAVQIALLEMLKQTRWELTLGPVAVELRFAMPRPKSHFGTKWLRPSASKFHVNKPDVDNLAKLILDQITRSGCVWRDDSQVVSLTVHKFWAVGAEHRCSVWIDTVSSPVGISVYSGGENKA